jgi:hypothetical protein
VVADAICTVAEAGGLIGYIEADQRFHLMASAPAPAAH